MDAGVLQRSIFIFFLGLFFVLETSIAQKPPSEAIWQSKRLPYEDDETIFSSSRSETQLDVTPGTVPIVNPTTPTPTTPIVNPPTPTIPEPVTNPNPNTNPPPTTTNPNPNPNPNPPPATTNPNPNTNPPPTTTNPNPNTNPTPTTTTPSSGGAWCVANPTASETTLQVALDYACGYGGADCSGIQPGAPCYDPNTVKDHASYAFNVYYQKNPIPTSCVFGGAAQLAYTDPSYGNCHFASPNKTPTPTPPTTPTTPPTVPMTPPSTTTPVNPYTPNGSTGYGSEPTDYGSEPTGTPSSAKIVSCNLQQLLVVTCLMLWVTTANYL